MNIEMLKSLVGEVLKIDRGGPESRIGKLLTVGEDFLTLLTKEDGVILYKTHHIKSITQNAKNKMELDLEVPEEYDLINTSSFKKACTELVYKWIKVNRGGKESLEGVLDDITDDYITLVVNEEVIRIAMFHIRSLSYGVMKEEAKQEESKEKTKENKEQKNEESKEKKKENKGQKKD